MEPVADARAEDPAAHCGDAPASQPKPPRCAVKSPPFTHTHTPIHKSPHPLCFRSARPTLPRKPDIYKERAARTAHAARSALPTGELKPNPTAAQDGLSVSLCLSVRLCLSGTCVFCLRRRAPNAADLRGSMSAARAAVSVTLGRQPTTSCDVTRGPARSRADGGAGFYVSTISSH